jgi:hypothetical protein
LIDRSAPLLFSTIPNILVSAPRYKKLWKLDQQTHVKGELRVGGCAALRRSDVLLLDS